MWGAFVSLVLGVLAVPPEPSPPFGEPGSLAVFRAAPAYYRYRLCLWLLKQGLGLLAFVVSVAVLERAMHQENAPALALGIARGLEGVVGVLLAGTLVVGYALQRLDYELRWYMVTDRSLRIREGVLLVREMTLTFVNVQNVSIDQGPLQRLLGVADLRVQTAGGGGGEHSHGDGMHAGVLRGIDNAEHLRELVLARMRQAGGSGLGDRDDQVRTSAVSLDDACRALVEEARALGRAADVV